MTSHPAGWPPSEDQWEWICGAPASLESGLKSATLMTERTAQKGEDVPWADSPLTDIPAETNSSQYGVRQTLISTSARILEGAYFPKQSMASVASEAGPIPRADVRKIFDTYARLEREHGHRPYWPERAVKEARELLEQYSARL